MEPKQRMAGRLITQAQRKSLSALNAALASHGTNMTQWSVLRVISENPGASARALSVLTSQSEQSLGTLVTPLVKRALVKRSRMGNRLVHELTDQGRALVVEALPTVDRVMRQRMEALSSAELDQLCVLLQKIA